MSQHGYPSNCASYSPDDDSPECLANDAHCNFAFCEEDAGVDEANEGLTPAMVCPECGQCAAPPYPPSPPSPPPLAPACAQLEKYVLKNEECSNCMTYGSSGGYWAEQRYAGDAPSGTADALGYFPGAAGTQQLKVAWRCDPDPTGRHVSPYSGHTPSGTVCRLACNGWIEPSTGKNVTVMSTCDHGVWSEPALVSVDDQAPEEIPVLLDGVVLPKPDTPESEQLSCLCPDFSLAWGKDDQGLGYLGGMDPSQWPDKSSTTHFYYDPNDNPGTSVIPDSYSASTYRPNHTYFTSSDTSGYECEANKRMPGALLEITQHCGNFGMCDRPAESKEASIDECAARCDAAVGCLAFVYNSAQTCYLKAEIMDRLAQTGTTTCLRRFPEYKELILTYPSKLRISCDGMYQATSQCRNGEWTGEPWDGFWCAFAGCPPTTAPT